MLKTGRGAGPKIRFLSLPLANLIQKEEEGRREGGESESGGGVRRVQATACLKEACGGYACGLTSALEHRLAIGSALSTSPARAVLG